MKITDTPIAGVKRLQRFPITDTRGSFTRLYCHDELAAAGIDATIAQINLSHNLLAGTVRGIHFQHPPQAEHKVVSCLHGAVYDVVVDLRRGSPTFLQWYAEELSASNALALAIPPGVAHAFQTLTDGSTLLYLHSCNYSPTHEDGLRYDDPRIGVHWPRPVTELSPRDQSFPLIDSPDFGLNL